MGHIRNRKLLHVIRRQVVVFLIQMFLKIAPNLRRLMEQECLIPLPNRRRFGSRLA